MATPVATDMIGFFLFIFITEGNTMAAFLMRFTVASYPQMKSKKFSSSKINTIVDVFIGLLLAAILTAALVDLKFLQATAISRFDCDV